MESKLNILQCIGKVYELSKNSKLEETFFENANSELEQLSEYFKVTKHQSLIIVIVFALSYKGNSVEFNDMFGYFDCNPLKLLEFNENFEALNSKGILNISKSDCRYGFLQKREHYTINEKITEAIIKNMPMPDVKQVPPKDIIELLEKFYNLSIQRKDEEIGTMTLFFKTKELFRLNLHFPLIKKINDYKLCVEDAYFFIYLIWKTISGKKSIDIGEVADSVFDNESKKIKYVLSLLSKESVLVGQKHIEIVESFFFNDTLMKLSDSSIKMLHESGIHFSAKTDKKENVIDPEKINYKDLYFNESECKQIDILRNLMQEDNFKEAQKRLQNKGLSKGIAIILHGLPGTGKTETVLQLAKSTDREIVKVDISNSKSMWFGESEKKIKRIFTDYKEYAENCKRMPILLFNEADAIISTRKVVSSSNVAQTENAIQNIILEELENFEGILIATTNLVSNIDSAFERRFLFKIEFKKPDVNVKTKIWKSKFKKLKLTECNILASRYDFSGAQIDNVIRKKEIYEIINGNVVSFNNIIDFCNEEYFSESNRVKIGYTKN